ncbi:hypothetical protein I5Q41_12245 [Pseudomonas monteilii]|uniref:hypothetical protein n=1 Tax=Pseudomonas TaxID=286 RepID=UPI00048B45B2|nr:MULTISPECIES: hypothetical protein [Pseudomonas]MBH3455462.1 hypothetical protein [Pseudomonas monteilii]
MQDKTPCKSVPELFAEALVGWDQKKASGPVLEVAHALVQDGRFDEVTHALVFWLTDCQKDPQLNHYVLGKLPPLVFNYTLKQPGINETVAMEMWGEEGVAASVKAAAMVPGRLGHVVRAFVNRVVRKTEASATALSNSATL